jgi:hypothetical protein
MTDFATMIAALRRPRLLIRAARHGMADYERNRDLRRLLGATPTPAEAMARLIETEARLEGARREGEASYSVARHVEVMIAMLSELRLVRGPA